MKKVPTNRNPRRGKLEGEGKTKRLYHAVGRGFGEVVIVEQKNTITKHNDPSQTEEFESKGRCSTTFASRVFELLTAAGIPNAFIRQTGDNEFLMHRCKMLGLEVVIRRLAMGSYFDRNPHMRPKAGDPAPRLHRLVIEMMLKTTEGIVPLLNGSTHDTGIRDPKRQDPLIVDPSAEIWKLAHPHLPLWDTESYIGEIEANRVMDPVHLEQIERLARLIFLLLESALTNVGSRLADLKLEFGFLPDGTLVVADVIDPDSLRQAVWNNDLDAWIDLSKQSFRDGIGLEEVERKYLNAAMLAERIRVPRQALITWIGSPKDTHPPVDSKLLLHTGITHEKVMISGHKQPEHVLPELEHLLAQYPDGGVIIAKVGMSNGLGPILAARTSLPVISVVANAAPDDHGVVHLEDAWSSLRMPSDVPNLTVLSEKNAITAALNILARKDPVLYMFRQYEIEKLAAV
ncbi:MAG: phosphoribosylaminoimidazolesuccinocarboxamide synthase [Patescibacteria group bacterium]